MAAADGAFPFPLVGTPCWDEPVHLGALSSTSFLDCPPACSVPGSFAGGVPAAVSLMGDGTCAHQGCCPGRGLWPGRAPGHLGAAALPARCHRLVPAHQGLFPRLPAKPDATRGWVAARRCQELVVAWEGFTWYNGAVVLSKACCGREPCGSGRWVPEAWVGMPVPVFCFVLETDTQPGPVLLALL